jgi:hypothetical protein
MVLAKRGKPGRGEGGPYRPRAVWTKEEEGERGREREGERRENEEQTGMSKRNEREEKKN